MKDFLLLNRKEILRYLGYGNNTADSTVSDLMEECIEELQLAATAKYTYQIFDLKVNANNIVDLTCFKVQSRNLSINLKGCNRVVLFAATLGAGVDRLLQKYNKIQMSKAVIIQAAATTMIEEFCDIATDEIKSKLATDIYFRPRFSPGYGDFPLSFQKQMIETLSAPKKIGLTLTDSLIMAPSKSVTAVIGISDVSIGCHKQGCEVCGKVNCSYRRT